MPARPFVTCPRCRVEADYHATIEMLDPPVGKIDIGHCAACACLFERVRDSGMAYPSTSWLPVCSQCRQPVSVIAISGADGDQTVRWQCQDHHDEQWHWHRPSDRWTRVRS